MNRRVLLLVLCVLLLLVGGVQAWGEDMGAWDYRKEFTINNTGSELTNYQVMFTVNRSAGSDSGTTVYLNGKCEEDYDDVRFVMADDTTLYNYWIESSSSTVASIWVNFTSLPTGDTTAYLYYGNAAAAAVSDGGATFPFFDDFTGTALDTSKWSATLISYNYGTGTIVISGGQLTLTQTGGATRGVSMRSAAALASDGYTIRYKVDARSAGVSTGQLRVILSDTTSADPGKFGTYFSQIDNNIVYLHYGFGVGNPSAAETFSTSTPAVWECQCRVSNPTLKKDGTTKCTGSGTPSAPPGNYLRIWVYDTNTQTKFDWILVRKYTATEPTVSAWGSEEESPGSLTVDFTGLPITGYVPLTVYFTDASIGYNVTLDTWAWSFGDTSMNSTQQNPAHTYTTSGLYTVILTVTNTSFSKTNTTAKTAYINATVNPDTPTADFTTTETCGNVGDTFYFIDFSTGGGLYAWNWSFGDGSYSEMRNPTHQYAGEGTYDVSLHVWGAYGDDSLLRSNLITVPCGAATPTPTPTVTPTGTGTIPVQEEIPEGHLTPLAFVVLAFLVCGLTVYTFADNQNRNYLYIATAAVAMIVSFLLGIFLQVGTVSVDFVNTLDEVTVNESVLSTYDVQRVAITDLGFGWFFIFWGVVMLIITILAVIELFREPQRRYEE